MKDNNKLINTNEESNNSPLIKNKKANDDTLRKLWTVCIICSIFMIIELTGGYLADSIAIMSDAAHLLSDLLGFFISILSIYISRRKANHHMSFGYHRAGVIGALVSINIIWGLTIWLLYAAILRVIYPTPVNGLYMLITAVIGFIFNITMGLVLMREGIGNKYNFFFIFYFLNLIILKDHQLHSHHDHDHGIGHTHGDSHGHTHKNSHSLSPAKNLINNNHEKNHRESKNIFLLFQFKLFK
jgi:zinc transporter 2